jgi:acyl-CoA hydrolase
MTNRSLAVHPEVRVGSEVHLDEWVAPEVADEHGHLQAGKILEWMDVVGALAATRHCRSPVVTVSIEGMDLRHPIRVGERVAMTARVAYTSRHSVGISVRMDHGDAGSGPRPGLEAYMTFVPLDRRGRPLPVPPFSPETPAERARFREGQLRREFRRRLESGQLAAGELHKVAERDWPLLIRQWMSRLPRYLRNPWERMEPNATRTRHRSYMHKIEPVRLGTLNFHGTLYGGTLMRWAEVSAALSARAFAGGEAMRCSGLHGLCFLKPVQRDRFVHVRSVVVHSAQETLTTLVSVQAEEPASGRFCENLRAFFTYAPLDERARVAPIDCQSAEEKALFEEVEQRHALQRRIGTAAAEAA